MRKFWWGISIALFWAGAASGITIGAGPVIGTNKNPNVLFGSAVWYQEFQDWTASDVRALDTNADGYSFGNAADTARDLIAFYSHDDGTNVYFRLDFFDLLAGQESGELDVYVAIDCAPGGQAWLPDFTDTKTDRPWEVVVGVYNSAFFNVYDDGWTNRNAEFRGSYWRADLDAVEFGVSKALLLSKGWDGTAPIYFQPFTCRDGTDNGSGEINGQASDLVDSPLTIVRGTVASNGWLLGGIASTATAGRAKYAAIAHANQSVAPRDGTQRHIYTDYSATLKPGFVRLMDSAEMLGVPVNLHISGTLLMSFLWATQDPGDPTFPTRDGPVFLERVRRFVTPGQGPGSLIGGVLAEHIMPYFEGEVNRRSIGQNSELLYHLFGLNEAAMGVMHVPERVFHSNTNAPWVHPAGPLKGRPFEDILASGFEATYLDEVTHLHWWFYPQENNPSGSPYGGSWDDYNCGRWAGGQGNDEAPYHHKVHKINGVYCFMINDREDQSKFGPDDSGLNRDTRYTLLQKALHPDYAQLTLVFDDWEAYAGNSFASATPNNNADQWDRTIRWIANHPWIEMVNLKQVLDWAKADSNWVIDHGYVYDKSMQTYEWLKRASEHDYDHWYYGTAQEESFFSRTARVHNAWAPATMKKYGDLNTPGTLIRDAWDTIQTIASTNLRRLAEWSYSAMIYETAWHDEDANPDQYQSRNYQQTFNRVDACTTSYEDTTYDPVSGWAVRLHGHVRKGGIFKAASDWVQNIKSGTQGATPTGYAADIDDDQLDEYVLCNNRVFLVFERWGARLVHAFVFDPALNGGDAVAVIGAPVTNPAEESDNEGANNNRCSAFKDQYAAGPATSLYTDDDYALTAPVAGAGAWTFQSADGKIRKTFTLEAGRDVVRASYALDPAIGSLYVRYGLGPNQFDLMKNGQVHLVEAADGSFRGLRNTQGGAAFVVAGHNVNFVNNPDQTDWDGRKLPLVQQFETVNTATNWTAALAFSEASARDLDGDGLNNTNEFLVGTDHEQWDTDGDGMPDGFEVAFGLAATTPDGELDDDHDGLSNWAEFIAGTAPNSAGSVFRVADAQAVAAGMRLQHTTASGRWYEVYVADGGIAGEWNWRRFGNTNPPVGAYVEPGPGGGTHSFTDDFSAATSGGPATNGLRVYGIRVRLP